MYMILTEKGNVNNKRRVKLHGLYSGAGSCVARDFLAALKWGPRKSGSEASFCGEKER